MNGLIWIGAVWGLLLAVLRIRRHRWRLSNHWLRPENIGLVFALLGTHATAGTTEAEEILRDPFVYERIIRGSLSALAILIAAPYLLARLRQPHHRIPGMAAIVTYVAIAAMSILYSAAPVVTAGKVFELTAGVVPVAAIALAIDARQRIRHTLNLVVLLESSLLAVAIIGFFAMPSIFAPVLTRPGFLVDQTMVAPFAHPNALSATSALIAAYALARFFQSTRPGQRRGWIAAFLLGTAGAVLSSGRQGVAIWLGSVAVLLFVHKRRLFMLLLAPAAAVAIATWWDPIVEILGRGRPETLTTFTGRIFWWQAALQVWGDHPWTGYGYGAGGRFVALRSLGNSFTSSVHSGYLEALVGVGLLGLIPLVYVVGRILRWSARELRLQRNTAFAILIIPLMLRTGVSLGFGGWLNAELVLFLCLTSLVDSERQLDQKLVNTYQTSPVAAARHELVHL